MLKIGLWGPFRGKVGTEKAQIEYARTLQKLGHEVFIIQLTDEYDDYKSEFNIISVWGKPYNNIGKSNLFFRRDFFALAFFSKARLKRIISNSQNK